MQVRTQNILALALASALLSPMAMAEKGGKSAMQAVRGNAAAQTVPTAPPVADVAAQARDVVPDSPVPARDISEGSSMTSETEFAAQVRAGERKNQMADDALADHDPADDETQTDTDVGVSTRAQAESRAAAPSRVARDAVFAELDVDGDGSISSTEAEGDATFQARFGTIDSDADGIVTDAEYRAFARTQVPGAPPEQSQGSVNAAGNSSVVQRATFAPLDSDGDGRISVDEAGADTSFSERFELIDSDGDGFVTDAEFRAHAKAGDATP